MVVQRLADAAPAEMLASLRGPLQEALQGVQQDVDRPRTCASAEALGGLLACSATYHTPGPHLTGAIEVRDFNTIFCGGAAAYLVA